MNELVAKKRTSVFAGLVLFFIVLTIVTIAALILIPLFTFGLAEYLFPLVFKLLGLVLTVTGISGAVALISIWKSRGRLAGKEVAIIGIGLPIPYYLFYLILEIAYRLGIPEKYFTLTLYAAFSILLVVAVLVWKYKVNRKQAQNQS